MGRRLRTTPLTLVASAAGVGVVGLVDYVTGYELRLFPLYFLPVARVAWNGSRTWTLAMSVLSAGCWVLANWSAGRTYTHPYVWPFNAASQLFAFATVGLLVVELRRRLVLAEDLVRQDALTGLLNRRGFEERGELLLAVARRGRRPFTIAYVDLDGFKQVNDAHGHGEGDRALRAVGAVLRQEFRASDLTARLGGDEFGVLLHDTDHDAARTALERMRATIATEMPRHGWAITASVGVLAYARAPATLAEALAAADALMYRAKQRGKDVLEVEQIGAAAPAEP